MPNEITAVWMHGPFYADRMDWNDAAVRRHLCLLAQVAEATASAIVVTDAKGVIVWVNRGFTRITGYPFEEAVGRIPGELLQGPDTDPAESARVGAAIRAQSSVSAELINYSKDGRRYWIGMKIEPLVNAAGELDGFMAIEADITERHSRTLEMEQLTARFKLATQAAHIGVFERSVDNDEVWWSEEVWRIAGQDPLTFRPNLISWLELVHPADRKRVHAAVGGPKSARAARTLQYRIVRPDGTIRHVQSIASPSKAADRSLKRISGVLLDVTQRVEFEEREQALQQQLRESAHQAGMAQIATGVLHNVGNILNSLGIANATARRDVNALRVDRLEQAVSLIRSNRDNLPGFLTEDERGKHLPDYLPALSAQFSAQKQAVQSELETIEHLLEHLREVVSAQQVLAHVGGRHESINLSKTVEAALLVHLPHLAQIEVIRKFEDLPPVNSDPHKVLQILVNLIKNALDAVQAGHPQRGSITVRIAREANHALVTVEDTGVGMSTETLARLWQFGFTTKKSGHGFGLHNSANAANEIGATLTAHSDGPGKGSRFTLRIPIDKPEPMLSGAAA